MYEHSHMQYSLPRQLLFHGPSLWFRGDSRCNCCRMRFQGIYFQVLCRAFIPSVVEPSFGIGRIMYCLFEHCYYAREKDSQRTVFKFSPVVAPTKATVFPLVQKAEMNATAVQISASLRKAGVSNIIDTTGRNSEVLTKPYILGIQMLV